MAKTLSNDERLAWIKDHYWRADNAYRIIHRAKKQKTSDFDERIRFLTDFMDALFVKGADSQQLEMFNPEDLLSPRLKQILESPMKGLE